MMLEPNVIVLYANDLKLTGSFYQDLLGLNPIEESPSFRSFKLSNGMILALKAKHTLIPPSDTNAGHGELAFTVNSHQEVDTLFLKCQEKMEMILKPSQFPFGYTFVGLDPDGQRLRFICLGE